MSEQAASPVRTIFVFGSNLRGIHGAGSAKHARQYHGAILGQGEGLQGESYAIPTKDAQLRRRPLHDIADAVSCFLEVARAHPHWRFEIVAIGTGLAGYQPDQIATMFAGAPSNCHLPATFLAILVREVGVNVQRNTTHPEHDTPGFDRLELNAPVPAALEHAITSAQRRFWAVSRRDPDGFSAVLYKPSGAIARWN